MLFVDHVVSILSICIVCSRPAIPFCLCVFVCVRFGGDPHLNSAEVTILFYVHICVEGDPWFTIRSCELTFYRL